MTIYSDESCVRFWWGNLFRLSRILKINKTVQNWWRQALTLYNSEHWAGVWGDDGDEEEKWETWSEIIIAPLLNTRHYNSWRVEEADSVNVEPDDQGLAVDILAEILLNNHLLSFSLDNDDEMVATELWSWNQRNTNTKRGSDWRVSWFIHHARDTGKHYYHNHQSWPD